MKNKLLKTYLIIAIFFMIGCENARAKQVPDISLFMPKETDVPGWELIDKPILLKKKKINSLAQFKEKNIIEYSTCKFRSYKNKEWILEIQLFRFDKPLNCFSEYSQDKFNSKVKETIGDFSYLTENTFNFINGKFYISVKSSLGDTKKDNYLKFQEIINKNINPYAEKIKFPDYIKIFHKEKNLSNLVYFHNGHVEIPGLDNFFISNINSQIIFTKKETDYDAMNLYTKIMNSTKKKYIVSKSDNIQLLLKQFNKGFIFLTIHKNYIFGVLNAENITIGKAIIKGLYSEIIPVIK